MSIGIWNNLTAKELSLLIANEKEPTDLEIAAMQHIDILLDQVADLEEQLATMAEIKACC